MPVPGQEIAINSKNPQDLLAMESMLIELDKTPLIDKLLLSTYLLEELSELEDGDPEISELQTTLDLIRSTM